MYFITHGALANIYKEVGNTVQGLPSHYWDITYTVLKFLDTHKERRVGKLMISLDISFMLKDLVTVSFPDKLT